MTAISGMALLVGDKRDATKIMRENGVKFSKSPDDIFSTMDMPQRRCRQSRPSWAARRQRCGTIFLPSRISCRPFSSMPHRRSRSEEHTSEIQSLMRISYAVFCLKKKQNINYHTSLIYYSQIDII